MVELTDREKKIVLIKFIIHGTSPFAEAKLSDRLKMLKEAVKKCGLHYDEDELFMLGEQCVALQKSLSGNLMSYIKSNTDVVIKAHQELAKGNDSLRKELGDDLADEGVKILSKKKWYNFR